MAKHRLNGNVEATMDEARATLKKAREEAKGQERGLRTRQAAEKVWLAVSTAADAMVGPVNNASQVFRAFERAWGAAGRKVAEDIEVALHRGCFYGNAVACRGPYVDEHAVRLGRTLKKPVRDAQIRRRLAGRG